MAELGELLDADPRVPERLDRGPGPKRPIFLAGHVPAFAGVGVVDPGPRRVVVRARLGAIHGPAVNRERASGRSGLRRLQACGRRGPLVVHPSHADRQDRESLPGPLVHARLARTNLLLPCQVFGANGTRCSPQGPARRILHRPLGDVEIERTNCCQAVLATSSPFAHFDRLPVRADNVSRLGKHALFPGCGDLGRQVQRGNPGVVAFEIPPEQATQVEGQVPQRRVIEPRLALLQVGDEQVANRAACDCVPTDQLGRAELADSAEGPDR